jgi:quinohemoprotein ethanol dehydrogenase
VRSEGKGDNLFLDSIVAVSGKTGEYKWHYQTVPAETWGFDAMADIELADLTIAGRPRRVLMSAEKNGFYYVIDCVTGRLISAEPFAKVTWASHVDLKTGRPVENPGVRYPNGTSVEIWPTVRKRSSPTSPRSSLVDYTTTRMSISKPGGLLRIGRMSSLTMKANCRV